jgi:hypothetical protein
MIYKPYLLNKPVFVVAVVFISTMIIITAPIISNVNAADKEGPGYTCSHIPGSGTIGQVKCCSTGGDTMYCTICDNTTPPSNCQPRTVGKFDSGTVLHSNKGGVLSQNDDSSNQGGSNTVDPDKIIEGGTFNDGSGSSNSDDSKGGIDSSKINSGAAFNQ